jgi:hypothetical protein
MSDDKVKEMINDKGLYDDSREDSLRSMLSDFYSKRMLSTAILVWACFLFFFALGVVSAILFFRTDQTRSQIMYAAIFVCLMHWASLIKIFAWQTIHKNSIKREIKRLEIQLAEACKALQKTPEQQT